MQITSEKFTGNMFGLSRKSLYIQRTLVVLLSTGFFLGLPIQAFAQDKIPPALMLEGADIEAIPVGTPYSDPGTRAVDGLNKDITNQVARSGYVDPATPGIYLLRYDVTDSAGNTATPVYRQIIVEGAEIKACIPVVDCPPNPVGLGSNVMITVTDPCLQGTLVYQLFFNGQVLGANETGGFFIDHVTCEQAGVYSVAISNGTDTVFAQCDIIIEPCGEGEGTVEGAREGEGSAEGVQEGEGQTEGVAEGEGSLEGEGGGEGETGPCKTWTDAVDFEEGYSYNLEPVQDGDDLCLELVDDTKAWPYIAIANSARDTITRAEVNTGNVVGEYKSRPDGMSGNPSRTTVDGFGNVWVGNRNESLNSLGSVTRIGLAVGGTRVDASGTPDPNGDYIQNPSYCTCEDRDSDGLIKTSRGYPWANGVTDYTASYLQWQNIGNPDGNGGVSTAEDECITAYVRVAGTNVRFVAVDPFGDIWTGGLTNRLFQKIKSSTAAVVPSSIFNSNCGGYGGLVGPDNVLWSAYWSGYGDGFMRYDVNFPSSPLTCVSGILNYGVGIDPDTCHIWTTSAYYDNNLREVDPSGVLLNTYDHFGGPSPVDLTRGVVISNGNVWVAHCNSNTVGRVTTAGVFLGNVPVGVTPTGVAVDTNGKIWSTNLSSNNASRIDPSTIPGTVDLTVDLGPNSGPYNYSDMTGTVLQQAVAPQGSWTTTYDSGILGCDWSPISWTAYQDPGTTIIVQARASDSPNPSGPWTVVSNNVPFTGVLGRYIQIQVILIRPPYCSGGGHVKLCDLTVCKRQGCMELELLNQQCDPKTGDIQAQFQVTNLTSSAVNNVLITPQTPNIIMSPNVINGPIASGASVIFNTTISGAIPGQVTCFTVTLVHRDEKNCCCSTTVCLRFDCSGCLEFLNEKIECDPDNPGTFLYTFQVKNRTSAELHHLYFYPPAGTTMPNYVHLVPALAPSATSNSITLPISTTQPPGSTLCFGYSAHDRQLNECCDGQHCITVPDCLGLGEGEGMMEGEREGEGSGPCLTDFDCDDGDPCTNDICDPATGGCVNIPIQGCEGEPEGTVEGQTEGEFCATNLDCDDGNPCTEDVCDPILRICTHTFIQGCEGQSEGSVEGEGVAEGQSEGEGCLTAAECDDGNPCTEDICEAMKCIHIAIPGCEGESEGALEGEGGEGPCLTDLGCDDGNPCTNDVCDPATGLCSHFPIQGCEGEHEGGIEGVIEGEREGAPEGVAEGSREGALEGEGGTEGLSTTCDVVIICPLTPWVKGTSVQLCVSGNYDCVGTDITFNWYNNNIFVTSTTGPCFTIPSVSCNHAGVYTVTITGSSGTYTTAPCKIKVVPCAHTGDPNNDSEISLSEILRFIQFYNSNGLHCDPESEDGFAPGPGNTDCLPHSGDYSPQDWNINLTEMLRMIQFYNSGGYHPCPDEGTEDGFCPGIV